ncbi:hypothetical protein JAAARDRAFT_152171 [Jaapia argillacea MUCL 33604]|uniref:CSN8/PSMD8/EIF3K domain-containing protein n=1 Tax=Jaapia argillacea MUCL 33604 TaxID=933084 RepID=A0A067Q215_9AGAM|nr:hypothetical protein JAAARDRAFT_152171 [Jaapia argillacea MUCL 33604]
MNNGPPTPPPTTERELLEQQQTAAPAVAVAEGSATNPVPTPPAEVTLPSGSAPQQQAEPQAPQQDAYTSLFPTIADLALQGKYEQLVQLAEERDLNTLGDRQYTRMLLIAPLVLSYLILDQLPPARFALQRLPNQLANHPLTTSLFKLLASTWERKYINVYPRAEEVYELVSRPGFPDRGLAPIVQAMTTTFIETFRERTFALLSRAYTSLSLGQAQMYLGLGVDRLIPATQAKGWVYDVHLQVFVPRPIPTTAVNGVPRAPSTLASFHTIANGVIQLES